MSRDTNTPDNGKVVKIDARVSDSVLGTIDEEYDRRGYTPAIGTRSGLSHKSVL
ncbi:hypothetical protein [Halobellus captivus]|uniref:hypothetical protein n=1 Tax=Halobellus captivus TaxID=2592614 RepID=UPI001396B39F|nr:hypothetical protein [Halobellus captivus]